MSITLVTGGTGLLGARAVAGLRAAGREVRVLSRHPHPSAPGVEHVVGDVVRDRGLAVALEGVDTVLHLAGGARGDDRAAAHLVRRAADAGVGHIVGISVIGADRMPIGYFRAKAAVERTLADSGVPYSLVRVAQVHDLVLRAVRAMTAGPAMLVPGGLRFEPVSADEAAARLVELALGAPAGPVADLAGPEVLDVRALAAGVRRRPSIGIRLPGAVGRAYRAGDNLAGASADRGKVTWAEFLARR